MYDKLVKLNEENYCNRNTKYVRLECFHNELTMDIQGFGTVDSKKLHCLCKIYIYDKLGFSLENTKLESIYIDNYMLRI